MKGKVKKLLIIHGPNLNLLGKRETEIYGTKSLDDINKNILSLASELGTAVKTIQLNSEGEIVEVIQKGDYDALIINPAAYTHTSILPPTISHSRPVSRYGVNSSGNPEKAMNLDSASRCESSLRVAPTS